MADSKRVELILGIKTEGAVNAAKGIESMTRAADKAQEDFIINSRIAANSATTLQKALGQIGRAEQIQRLGVEFGNLAKKTKDMGGAVAQLNKQLKELGASKDEIRSAADAFSGAGQSGGGGDSSGSGLGGFLRYVGREGRALPSVAIPGGGGIGTDAVSKIVGLTGALTDAAGKSSLVTNATKILTPLLGAQAAATYAAAAPIALFVAGFAAMGIAISTLTEVTGRNAAAITAFAETQREINQDIVNGLTTEEANKKLEDLIKLRTAEQALLDKNTAAYQSFENQALAAGTSTEDLGSTLSKVIFGQQVASDTAKALSADEQALADNIDTSSTNVQTYDADIQNLTRTIGDGSLAANDAAVAEKKLFDERNKTALGAADAAAKNLQAEQRALNATEDQNKKRLDTIDDERAVVERQIETLEASGVVSEEVTAKIAGLKDQLGLLGKESSFITDTALEASRAADAEKKAVKDAEDAAKKAAQAQEQYTKAVSSASTAYKTSLEDIGTRFRQTLSDNQLKFNRDLTDLTTKYRRDEVDLEEKARRSERDATQDQINDLKNIQKDAYKEEQDALREGDFKALFLAREKGAEELQQQQAEIDTSRQKREQANRDAQTDLVKNAQRQRQDRMLNNERQITDARTANERELAQARQTQQRALQMASEALNAELGLRQAFWNATVKQAQNALGQINGAQGATGGTKRPGGFSSGSFVANSVGRLISK